MNQSAKLWQKKTFLFCLGAVAIFVSILFTLPLSAQENDKGRVPEKATILIGGECEYPPYSFLDKKGRPTGFNVAVTRAIAETMGMDIEIRLDPWSETRKSLESGTIDAIQGMYYSEERDRIIDFSPPFAIVSHAIFARRDSPAVKSVDEIKGRAIIVMRGDIMHDYCLKNTITDRLVLASTAADVLRLLASGKHDHALLAKLPGLYWVRELKLTNVVTVGRPIQPSKFCYAVGEGNTELLSRFSEGLAIIKHTNKYQELYDEWLGVLEPKGIALSRILIYAALVIIPLILVLIGSFLWTWILRKKIAENTGGLNKEIVEHKHAEEALRESEQKYRELVENIPQKIFYKDRDSVYVTCNNNYAQDFDITPDQITGKNDYDLYPKELAEKYRTDDMRIIKTGKAEILEEDYMLPDGQKFIVETIKTPVLDKKGEPVGILGIFMDITERKLAIENLQDNKVFLDNIIDQSPFAIWISDAEGTMQRANPALKKFLNLTDEQLIGKYNVLNDPVAERQGLLPLFLTVYNDGKTINFTCDWDGNDIPTLDLKSSKSVSIEATMFPIHNMEGKLTNVVLSWIDITERKNLADALQQSQKMESVGTLAGGVAHEFNNILGGITGYTEIAIDDASQDSSVRESLDEILKLSHRARDVVKQILAFSRKGKPERKMIQLHLLVKEEIKVLRAMIPSTIEIREAIDEQAGIVSGDPTQLQQVCMNLSMNAAHAMEERGGVLEIGLLPVVLDAEDVKQYSGLKPGEHVQVTVRDSGIGIDPKILDKIFDPFFTTKEVGKGTGMGLSVVYGIIMNHGGAITVESKIGHGTTFTVLFPAAKNVIEEITQSDDLPTGTENILIVDDEEYMVFPQKKILERLGYQVTAMTNSLETLELFKKDPQRYDLIITDLTMPNLTGDRLTSEVIAIRPDMPVIIATGYTDAIDNEKVKHSGIAAFISKPCKKQDLAKTIRLILDG